MEAQSPLGARERFISSLFGAFDARKEPFLVTSAAKPYRILHWNSACTELCGYTREDAVGNILPELLSGPRTTLAHAAKLQQIAVGGETSCAHLLNYRKDGSIFLNQITLAPLVGPSDEVVLYVARLREIPVPQPERLTIAKPASGAVFAGASTVEGPTTNLGKRRRVEA